MDQSPDSLEQIPNGIERAEKLVELSEREQEICASCTPENKEALIEWYIQEQEAAQQMPTAREMIELDIKAGVMQFKIAKDMEQRQEAFDRLTEAAQAARQDGMEDIADKADAAMDALDQA